VLGTDPRAAAARQVMPAGWVGDADAVWHVGDESAPRRADQHGAGTPVCNAAACKLGGRCKGGVRLKASGEVTNTGAVPILALGAVSCPAVADNAGQDELEWTLSQPKGWTIVGNSKV
jgi:hypothetical protein